MTSRNQNRGFRWVEGSIVVLKQIFRFMAMHETLLTDELSGFLSVALMKKSKLGSWKMMT